MDMLESFCGHLEISYGWNCVLLHLSLLARNALTCPFADVLADVGPNEFVRYGLSCSFHSGMTKAMDDIEYAPTVGKWHKWTCRSVGHVDEKKGGAYF